MGLMDDTFDQATGIRRFEPDRLDEDTPAPAESDEVGREAPDDVELGFCDSCGEDKPVEGGMNVEIDRTYVDNMLVSTEYDWFCSDCRGELEEALTEQQLERRNNKPMSDRDYYLYEK